MQRWEVHKATSGVPCPCYTALSRVPRDDSAEASRDELLEKPLQTVSLPQACHDIIINSD